MDDSLPGSYVHGIFQAKILEWVTNFFSRGSSQLRDQTYSSWHISYIAGGFFTAELPVKPTFVYTVVYININITKLLYYFRHVY